MNELLSALQAAFPSIDFEKEKQLYSDGILDSLAMVEVISILDDKFGITVTMDYMEPQNFESVETIWNMMQELQ